MLARWIAVVAAGALVVSAFVAPDSAAPSQAVDTDDISAPSDPSADESGDVEADTEAGEGDPDAESEELVEVDPEQTEVAPAASLPILKPQITGTAKVGSLLTMTVDSAATGDGYVFTYRWLRDGEPIQGKQGNQTTYLLTDQDLGATMTAKVHRKGSDAPRVTEFSEPTKAVAPGTFAALLPKISGAAKVSTPLRVTYNQPTVGQLTILWLRNGKSTGRSGETYTPTLSDRGAQISARLTLTESGYTTKVATTKKTAKVVGLATLATKKPRIKGVVKTGETLTVIRGSWTKGTKYKYQWFVAGKKVPGATKKSFKVTKQHRGKMITARVTGSKTNYYTKTVSSAPAKIKPLRGPRNKNGWAWPTDIRKYGYGYHDGYSVDIAASAGGPVYSPYSGVVVKVGGDGGGVPWICQVNRGWWRGENQTVIIRHKYKKKTVYSSVNHVAKGSSSALSIKAGTKVKAGQQIATEGMSGCTSGPHNHFLMKKTPGNYWGDVKPEKYIGKPKR